MNSSDSVVKTGTSRRTFIRASGGLAIGTGLLSVAANASPQRTWAQEVDVVVAGSGAAGLSAAIAATRAGASVLILEKGAVVGGTTSKSDGAIWICANHHMQAANIADPRADAIAYMAHASYPTKFRSGQAKLGLNDAEYALIETYYDQAASIIEDQEKAGITRWKTVPLPDYQDHSRYNKAPTGRILLPLKDDGSYGNGRELVRQLKTWVNAKNIPILTHHEVRGLLRNAKGEIIGVTVRTKEGDILIRARKAVIFGTGGFTHNPDLVLNFQPGPIFGGCAVPTNQGDFIRIGTEVGAKLGNMVNGWRAELVLEDALEAPSVSRDIWQVPGDSVILVNKAGCRVVDEKRDYHDRTRVHFVWDPLEQEYTNKFLFMIYDRRTAELYAGNFPLPDPGAGDAHIVTAASLPALAAVLQERLDSIKERVGAFVLSSDFAHRLSTQIGRYNDDATAGRPDEFGRGKYPYDAAWHTMINSVPRKDTGWPPSTSVTPTVHPIDLQGPFYAIILAAGMLDTNGGPVIDHHGSVLDTSETPIPGLYGAGNCIASPAAAAYWGAGGTIGPAMTFGTLAGRAAVAESIKQEG